MSEMAKGYQDRFGNRWRESHFNGHMVSGFALSLVMLVKGYPMVEIRAQQKREEPIGGWSVKSHQ